MFGKPQNEKEWFAVAKKMFIAGFFLLPGMWLLLLCEFHAYWKKNTEYAAQIRRYMAIGIIGTIVQVAAVVTWASIYLSKWQSWGANGDKLNVITYRG